jgi:hypothetical protein
MAKTVKKQNQKTQFQTHIQEPRWQQVISVIGVLIIVLAWLWLVIRN